MIEKYYVKLTKMISFQIIYDYQEKVLIIKGSISNEQIIEAFIIHILSKACVGSKETVLCTKQRSVEEIRRYFIENLFSLKYSCAKCRYTELKTAIKRHGLKTFN